MTSTFFGLELGKRAIFAQRKAMEVTSHNIANANTEGYSRQQAVMSASITGSSSVMNAPVSGQQVGTGVEVSMVENFRDAYIDERLTKETSTLGFRATADDLMQEIEAILNEPGDATIRDQLVRFWAAWQDLSVSPESTELRRILVERTDSLIAAMQDVDSRLSRLQGTPGDTYPGSIENQIETVVKQVNNLASQIAELNAQIFKAETAGQKANDLRDLRQKQLEELAELVNISPCYDSKGMLKVYCGTETLIDFDRANELFQVSKSSSQFSTVNGDDTYREFSNNTAVASGIFLHTADQRNVTLTVSQLAQAHKVHTNLTFHPLQAPLSTFGITSGNFSINGRDMWLNADTTSMRDLRDMLDSANLGLTATINEGGQLILEATQTGTANAIVATDGSSNLLTILNLRTAVGAQDAIFSCGNNQYRSSKNQVDDVVPGVRLFLNGTGVAKLDVRPVVTDGKLRALLELRDGSIDNLRQKLDQMAHGLVTEINALHRQGFGLDGQTGRNFFAAISSDDPNYSYQGAVQKLALADAIRNDLGTIAAAGGTLTGTLSGLPTYNGDGDGSNAILIAQIQNKGLFHGGRANFSDFYTEAVAELAMQSQRMARDRQYSEDLLFQLEGKRQEISGVSLDEELANLIRFQHAYNAAAKAITTADAMLDRIINQMF